MAIFGSSHLLTDCLEIIYFYYPAVPVPHIRLYKETFKISIMSIVDYFIFILVLLGRATSTGYCAAYRSISIFEIGSIDDLTHHCKVTI